MRDDAAKIMKLRVGRFVGGPRSVEVSRVEDKHRERGRKIVLASCGKQNGFFLRKSLAVRFR